MLGLGGKGGCGGVGVGGSGGNGGRGGSGSGLPAFDGAMSSRPIVFLMRCTPFFTSQEQEFNLALRPKNWIINDRRGRERTWDIWGPLLLYLRARYFRIFDNDKFRRHRVSHRRS